MTRYRLLLPVALAAALPACLVAGPSLAQEREPRGAREAGATAAPEAAPEAVDQTLGMAIMSIAVRSDGGILQRQGDLTVSKVAAGKYTITFPRSIRGCTSVAGNIIGFGLGLVRVENEATYQNPSNTTIVETYAPDGTTATDKGFSLITFCTQ